MGRFHDIFKRFILRVWLLEFGGRGARPSRWPFSASHQKPPGVRPSPGAATWQNRPASDSPMRVAVWTWLRPGTPHSAAGFSVRASSGRLPLPGYFRWSKRDSWPFLRLTPSIPDGLAVFRGGGTAKNRRNGAKFRSGTPRRYGGTPSRHGFFPCRHGFFPRRYGGAPRRRGFFPCRRGGTGCRRGMTPRRDGFFRAVRGVVGT